MSDSLRPELQAKGLQFVDVDRAAFRDALRGTSYYKDWRAKFGDDAWNGLQEVCGPL